MQVKLLSDVPSNGATTYGRARTNSTAWQQQEQWHRQTIKYGMTACGRHIDWQLAESRPERYTDRLCEDGCFSAYELELSKLANEEP